MKSTRKSTKKRRAPKKRGRSKRARIGENLIVLATMRQLIDRRERDALDALAGRSGGALDDEEESCPDLSDSSADPAVYLCQLLARGKYLLGEIDCDAYVTAHNACTPPS